MICGDLGFKSKNGQPCKQFVNAESKKPCIWHSMDETEKTAFGKFGHLMKKKREEIPNLTIGDLKTDDGIADTLQRLCEAAAGSKVDLRRVSEIRQSLNVAVGLRQTAATRELNKTLLRLEHGQKAVVLLEQLKGERVMKPLPGLKKVDPPKGEGEPDGE